MDALRLSQAPVIDLLHELLQELRHTLETPLADQLVKHELLQNDKDSWPVVKACSEELKDNRLRIEIAREIPKRSSLESSCFNVFTA
jgi:hypothetical protein